MIAENISQQPSTINKQTNKNSLRRDNEANHHRTTQHPQKLINTVTLLCKDINDNLLSLYYLYCL